MRFDLTADQRLLQEATADMLAKFSPLETVRAMHEEGRTFDRRTWQRGAELGWTSLVVPEEAGGGSVSGEGIIDATIIAEQFGRLCAPGPLMVTNVVAAALAEADNPEAHTELLGKLLDGSAVATWACCAPGRGWDPEVGAIDARREGDEYVLGGTHDSVEYGGDADAFLVLARDSEGFVQFIVPRDAPGVTVVPLESLDMVRGFARVDYAGVHVPASALVRTTGNAEDAIERQFQLAVVLQCAETVGVVERVLEFTNQWMFDRFSFGRPLASYQALKHRVADMTLWSESAQATMAAAAQAVQNHRADANELVSIAKSYVGQHATDIIQDCVQLHGGLGVTWEHDIHIYLRRATVNRVMWGTPSVHHRRIADLLSV